MTKARAQVLGCVSSAKEPVSAKQVWTSLGNEYDQATIYRALHYLEERGNLDSFILHCVEHGTERYYVLHTAEHRHWFHCEGCHRFFDLGLCRFEELMAQVGAEKGLTITSHTFYATGYCPECRRKM